MHYNYTIIYGDNKIIMHNKTGFNWFYMKILAQNLISLNTNEPEIKSRVLYSMPDKDVPKQYHDYLLFYNNTAIKKVDVLFNLFIIGSIQNAEYTSMLDKLTIKFGSIVNKLNVDNNNFIMKSNDEMVKKLNRMYNDKKKLEILAEHTDLYEFIRSKIDTDKNLSIEFNNFDISKINKIFIEALVNKIEYNYGNKYNKVTINFNECLIGQDIFDLIKVKKYNKQKKDSKIVEHASLIHNHVLVNFTNFFFKDVDLTKYDLCDIISSEKVNNLMNFELETAYQKILKNCLNKEVLLKIIDYYRIDCIENYKEDELKKIIENAHLDFRGLAPEELEEVYEKNIDIFSYILGKNGYNGIKLNIFQIEKISELKADETYIGRRNGDLHGFNLEWHNLSIFYSSCFGICTKNVINLCSTNLSNSIMFYNDMTNVITDEKTIFNENTDLKHIKINEYQVKRILNLEKGQTFFGRSKGDLHNFNLAELDLSEIDFRGANLSGSVLKDITADKNTKFDESTNLNGAIIGKKEVEKILNLKEGESYLGRKRGDLHNFNLINLEQSDEYNKNEIINIRGIDIDAKQVEKILNLKEGKSYLGRKKGDLSYLDLSLIDLSKHDLSHTNVEGAILTNTKLNETIVTTTKYSNSLKGSILDFGNNTTNNSPHKKEIFKTACKEVRNKLDGCTVNKKIIKYLLNENIELTIKREFLENYFDKKILEGLPETETVKFDRYLFSCLKNINKEFDLKKTSSEMNGYEVSFSYKKRLI